MALIAALTGLRVSEILGLQWGDIDFDNSVKRLQRGFVEQFVTELKTAGLKRALPMPCAVKTALLTWKEQTPFNQMGDWLFASPSAEGKKPFWPQTLLQRHIHPHL